jgi:hypothetical protein
MGYSLLRSLLPFFRAASTLARSSSAKAACSPICRDCHRGSARNTFATSRTSTHVGKAADHGPLAHRCSDRVAAESQLLRSERGNLAGTCQGQRPSAPAAESRCTWRSYLRSSREYTSSMPWSFRKCSIWKWDPEETADFRLSEFILPVRFQDECFHGLAG